MHFKDLVLILGIVAATGVLLYMKFFRKYKFTAENIDPAKQFSIEALTEGVRDAFDVILNTDYTELNLNKEETEKNIRSKDTLRHSLKVCTHGNTGAKMFVVDYIEDLLQRKFEVNEETINYAIPFNKVDELTSEYKFMILLHIYKKKFDMDAISQLITRNKLDRPLGEGTDTHYEISADDIDLTFRRHREIYEAFTFSDKLAILAQKIYSKYKGLGVVDDIRFMKVDGFNAGTSGVPQTFYQYGADTTYGAKTGELPRTACNAIWLMFKGKKMHLSCIGFETEAELERVTKNICRYNNAPTLSKMKGYIVNTTEDGCRVVGVRPDMAESFGFFIRKFDASSRKTLYDLYPFENVKKLSDLIGYLISGCMNTALTGQQATGKTTCLMSIIGYIPASLSIRLQEMAFELYLRKVYTDRNIMTFVDTPTVSAQAGIELQKKTDGDVNLFGEVAQASVVPLALKMGQTGSAMLMFTAHHKTTEDLVNEWGDDLVAEGASTDSFKATETVASVLDDDIHLERSVAGVRSIARVTQILPHIAEPYPEFDESDPVKSEYNLKKEYYYRQTDRRMFDTADMIVLYNNRYMYVNDIHPDKVAKIKTKLSDTQSKQFDHFLSDMHKEVIANRKLGFTGFSSMDSQKHIYFGTCVDENDKVIGHWGEDGYIHYNDGKMLPIDTTQGVLGDLAAADYAFETIETLCASSPVA